MQRTIKSTLFALIVLLIGALVAGCSASTDVELVDSGRSLDRAEVTAVIQSADPGKLAERPAEDAPGLRSEALSSLRRKGGTGRAAAELITTSFPSTAQGVPFYVERAVVDDVDAWIIVESVGRRGETLDGRRLWVLGSEGNVILSEQR